MHRRVVPSCSIRPLKQVAAKPVNSKILGLRNKIDRVDIKIVELLNKRAKYSLRIGQEKEIKNIQVEQPEREASIVQNIINQNTGPVETKDLLEIYVKIIEYSKSIQKNPNI